MRTCEDVSESISACDLEGWVFGSKDIQQKCSETAQNTQETESSNDPQQQDGLRVDTVICERMNKTVYH